MKVHDLRKRLNELPLHCDMLEVYLFTTSKGDMIQCTTVEQCVIAPSEWGGVQRLALGERGPDDQKVVLIS